MDAITLDNILRDDNREDVNRIVGSVLSDRDFDIKSEIVDKLPYTRKVGINEIVPEEYQQKLMEIDITMSQCFWLIGDITNELINGVNRERSFNLGKLISQKDICEAVGFFCHRSQRTVRYYWDVARYFPPVVRQKYDVPFSVYAEARWAKDWEVFLKIADENPMWAANRVRSEYYKLIGEEEPEERIASAVPDNGAEMPLPEEGEKWIGESQSRFSAVVIDKLEHTVDDLRDTINRIPLPNDIRERIRDVILEISDISQTIRREV